MRTLSFQVPDDVHRRILEATRVSGAATVQDWMIGALDDAAQEEIGDGPTRSEVFNAYGSRIGRLLVDDGFSTTAAVDAASDERLLAIEGFGEAALETVRGESEE